MENVLNSPPPPPPDGVPQIKDDTVGVSASLRQTMEAHRADALCASCHTKMDPLGFGLENYDATGKWRTQDGKFPIDPSGVFPDGKSFNGPAQMKALLLADMPEFTRALASKMLTYALGRGVESFDRIAVQNIVKQTADDDYKMQSLIRAIVHSVPFQEHRADVKSLATAKTPQAGNK
jgi:hypothetical protein